MARRVVDPDLERLTDTTELAEVRRRRERARRERGHARATDAPSGLDDRLLFRPTSSATPETWIETQLMHWVRKPLAASLRVTTAELGSRVLDALADIEAGRGRYAWVLDNEPGAWRLAALTLAPWFRAHPRPASIDELEVDYLYATFPSGCDALLLIDGERICPHPTLGVGPTAGSVRTKVPSLIPRDQWSRTTGFSTGIWLARVDTFRVQASDRSAPVGL